MAMGTADWSGLYLGLNAGGGEASDKVTVPPLNRITTPSFNIGGPLGGGTVGYNWQLSPSWLVGFEGDIDASGLSGSTGCPAGTNNCGSSNSYMATARGRIGWMPSAGPLMLYLPHQLE
jgi:outer membrane immunogenic protein